MNILISEAGATIAVCAAELHDLPPDAIVQSISESGPSSSKVRLTFAGRFAPCDKTARSRPGRGGLGVRMLVAPGGARGVSAKSEAFATTWAPPASVGKSWTPPNTALAEGEP